MERVQIEDEAVCPQAIVEGADIHARLDGKHIRIYDAFMIKESIKEIPGRFYDADDKAWVVPLSSENVSLLGLLGVALDDSLCPCLQGRGKKLWVVRIHHPEGSK